MSDVGIEPTQHLHKILSLAPLTTRRIWRVKQRELNPPLFSKIFLGERAPYTSWLVEQRELNPPLFSIFHPWERAPYTSRRVERQDSHPPPSLDWKGLCFIHRSTSLKSGNCTHLFPWYYRTGRALYTTQGLATNGIEPFRTLSQSVIQTFTTCCRDLNRNRTDIISFGD